MGITLRASGLLLGEIKVQDLQTSLNYWGTQGKLYEKDGLEKISPSIPSFIRLEFFFYSISPCKHILIDMLKCVTVTQRSLIPV